jgi:hypothetical protein
VVTDHKPLVGLCKLKGPEGALGQLMLKMQDQQINFKYRPGKQHTNAGALSRLHCNIILLTNTIDWAVEQAQEPALTEIKNALENNSTIQSNNIYAKLFKKLSLTVKRVVFERRRVSNFDTRRRYNQTKRTQQAATHHRTATSNQIHT